MFGGFTLDVGERGVPQRRPPLDCPESERGRPLLLRENRFCVRTVSDNPEDQSNILIYVRISKNIVAGVKSLRESAWMRVVLRYCITHAPGRRESLPSRSSWRSTPSVGSSRAVLTTPRDSRWSSSPDSSSGDSSSGASNRRRSWEGTDRLSPILAVEVTAAWASADSSAPPDTDR
jgi:hypothetical protein